MTTIAYRNGFLAVDSRAYSGNSNFLGFKQKLFLLPDGGAFATTSCVPGLPERIAAWIAGGRRPDQVPSINDSNFATMLVLGDGRVYAYVDSPDEIGPLEGEFFALGSGSQVALGAMEMGATAEEAVTAAAKFDVWTGGRVYVHQIF